MLTQTTNYSFHHSFSKESLKYTIDSDQLFKIVARSNGINLTNIVKAANPDFDFLNTPKTAYRHALDRLVNQGKIRYEMNASKTRRTEYFLNCEYIEKSKRVIFANFIRDMKLAMAS